MNNLPHWVLQLLRFGIVGVTAATIHFSVVIVLVQIGEMAPLIANIVGFIISFQMSYWGHRRWTFNETAALHRVALPKLLFIQLLNFAANEYLFYFLLTLNMPYPIALLLVLAILPIFTFTISKFWVFR